jgi:hypothetical protein
MATRVTVMVRFPSGRPVAGATIHGVDANALSSRDRDWYGTTGDDGAHTWTRANTGMAGDYHTYDVAFTDSEGVRWIGRTSERILTPVTLTVTLRPAYSVDLELPASAIQALGSDPEGRQILEGFREMKIALSEGLLRSPVVLAAWVLEGLIRVKANHDGKWKEGYGSQTLGQLLGNREILEMFPPALQPRVKAMAALRTPSAHNTGAAVHVVEGQLAASVAVETAIQWFDATAPPSPPEARPG